MKSILVIAITSVSLAACSSTATLRNTEQGLQTAYEDKSLFYRIETASHGNKLGQGYLRSFDSKCYLVSAAHIFEDGHKSVAVNVNNREIPIDLNQNYKYPTKFSQIDTRVFDVSELESNCPGQYSVQNRITLGQPLRLNFNSPDGDLKAINLSVIKLPGIEKENATFDVRVSNQIDKLETGHSGSVVLTNNGNAVGMLLQIKNSIGVIQPIENIDTTVSQSISALKDDRTLCLKNRSVCIGGGVLALGLLAVLAGQQGSSENGQQEQNNRLILNIPIP